MASKIAPYPRAIAAPDLAKLLPTGLSTTDVELATRLFLGLGVDSQISGLRTLCEGLDPLLSAEADLQPPLRQSWKRLRRTIARTLADPSIKRAAMPESGVVRRYPVLSCLSTAAFPDQAAQVASLKRILVVGCLLRAHGLPGADCIDRAADEIRLACEPYGERHKAVVALPSGELGLAFLVELRNSARTLQEPMESSSRGYGFLAAMLRLAEYVLRFRRFPRAAGASTGKSAEHPLPVLGTVEVAEVDPDQASSADPEPLMQLKEAATAPGDELSQDGFKANGIRTLYWLTQSESGVLWQRGRVSPQEWPALQGLLGSLPTLAKQDMVSTPEALVAGLVAATGLDPEELLVMPIGAGAELAWSGSYRRKIPRPEGAFDPSEQPNAADLYEGAPSDSVTFDLPGPVKNLLKACKPEGATQAATLGEALGYRATALDAASQDSTKLREACGALLRRYVNSRLTYRHLRLVLRHATYDLARDPLFVYLIAGRPNLAPPTQMYYGSIPVDRVLDVHRAVMRRIFGPP